MTEKKRFKNIDFKEWGARVVGAPVDIFINSRYAARFWFFTWLVTLAALICLSYYMPLALKKREHIVIMDASGTYHIAPIIGMEQATTMIEQCATYAALAALERGPTTINNNKMFQQMFAGKATEYFKQHYKATAPEFANLRLHQGVEIGSIDHEVRGEAVYAWVSGQLVRNGVVKGNPYADPLKFDLTLHFIKNPNLLSNGRLPLVVWRCDLITKKVGRSSQMGEPAEKESDGSAEGKTPAVSVAEGKGKDTK